MDVSFGELNSRPRDFDGLRVRLHGYVGDTNYKPRYVLRDSSGTNEIFLVCSWWRRNDSAYCLETVDLQPYVTYVCRSSVEPCTVLEPQLVEIVGIVRYAGPTNDWPLFAVNVEKVQPL